MALLRKLADCLGIMYQAPSRSPGIANSISPVADADLAFGWQGNLFASANNLSPAQNAVLCSVAITEDCFYILDGTWSVDPATAGAAGLRVKLQILDAAGKSAWELSFGAMAMSAAGAVWSTPIQSLRLHLLNGMIVQWIAQDAFGVADRALTSIALRKLLQDQL